MLLSSKPKVNEMIVSILSEGPIDSLVLLERVQKKMPVTKQAFYKALRELLVEEVVTKNKQTIILSGIWLNKLKGFVDGVESNYLAESSKRFLSLAEGDTMIFRFKSILDLDLLWVHYFYMLAKNIDAPVLFYNPHEFWSLFRSDIQKQLYIWIQSNKKKVYQVIGGNTPLDTSTTNLNKKYGLEMAYENVASLPKHTSITVIEDYVFYTVLDKSTALEIDQLYKKYTTWKPEVEAELQAIIARIKKSKVIIERNHKKAEKFRKKLMNHFIFYK